MHCGGRIQRMFEPQSIEQLTSLISELDDFFVLGGGTNTIFCDDTCTRPVIRLGSGFDLIGIDKTGLRAGGATAIKTLLSYCRENALSGIEFLSGIPGTIGGALWMNAGTRDLGIMERVSDIDLADRTGVHTLKVSDIHYGYRNGGIPDDAIITSAHLKLDSSSKQQVSQSMERYMEKRSNQPRGYSSGSVFKNPTGHSAGMLIEKAGLKGYRVGGASVSDIHANFIINDGTASTSDIRGLIGTVKQRIKDQFGIDLIEEVRIID